MLWGLFLSISLFFCGFLLPSFPPPIALSAFLDTALTLLLHPPLPLLHVLSSLLAQDYESKLQALQKQVETRSLAAETTEEEEEEEEGEIRRQKLSSG